MTFAKRDEAKASICAVERVADGGRVPVAAALRGGDVIRCPRVGISRSNAQVPQIQLNHAGLRGTLRENLTKYAAFAQRRRLDSSGEIGRNFASERTFCPLGDRGSR
jgi:hypothetical protein